jgi:hypothetical protein
MNEHRLTPEQRDEARDTRLAEDVARAEPPLVKFQRVWAEVAEMRRKEQS